MTKYTSQKLSVAKKFKRGLRYTIEVYVPLNGRGRPKTKNEKETSIKDSLRVDFDDFTSRIRQKDGVVTISRDL